VPVPSTSEPSWGSAHRQGLWTRVAGAFFWIAPPLLCLAIYRHGLQVWFTEDDFVWLGLLHRVHSWSDLWKALFTPTVDGTLRPLGERGFFLAFHAAFGLNPLPARICVFLTQFANLVLIGSLTAAAARKSCLPEVFQSRMLAPLMRLVQELWIFNILRFAVVLSKEEL